MAAVPTSSLVFSESEKRYYIPIFDRWTKGDGGPIEERVSDTQRMTGAISMQILRKSKLPDSALSRIWALASEGESFLKLQNFLASMRMCSILKQGKELSWANIQQCICHTAQVAIGKSKKHEEARSSGMESAPEGGLEEAGKREKSRSYSLKDSDQSEWQKEGREGKNVPAEVAKIRDDEFEAVDFPGSKPDSSPKLAFKASILEKTHCPPLPRIDEESPRYPSPTSSLSIEVVNPRSVSSGWFGSSFTLYTIVSKQPKLTQVDRRFRDLDWMHLQLCAQYKGVSIPPRPEKQILGMHSEKFLEERRAQMEKYLNVIAGNAVLRTSEVFKVFLTCPLESLDEEKVRVEKEAETSSYTGVEDVVDHFMAKIHSKISSTLISNFAPQSKEVLILESHLSRLSLPTSHLTSKFSLWLQSEKASTSLQSSTTIPVSSEFTTTMTEFAQMEGETFREMDVHSMDLREEMMRIDGLAHAISTYHDTSELYSQQEALINRKKSKQRSAIDEESTARYQSEIERAEEVLLQLSKQLEVIQRNLERDSEHFNEDRARHLTVTLAAIAETQRKRWTRNCEFWAGKQL